MAREHRELMQATFGSRVGDEKAYHYFGGSYWFEIRA
jgi:hypothetical protein